MCVNKKKMKERKKNVESNNDTLRKELIDLEAKLHCSYLNNIKVNRYASVFFFPLCFLNPLFIDQVFPSVSILLKFIRLESITISTTNVTHLIELLNQL